MAKLAFSGDAAKVTLSKEILTECAGVTDPDRCEFAVKMMECGMKAAISRGIDFKELI